MPFVEQVADRSKALSVPALAVHAVVDGNEAHAQEWKDALQIVAGFLVVSAKAG